MPTISKFISAQTNDPVCRQLAHAVTPPTQYDIDNNGILVQKMITDGALQKVASVALQQRVLFHSHNLVSAGDLKRRRMFDTIWRSYCGSHIASAVGSCVKACFDRRRN